MPRLRRLFPQTQDRFCRTDAQQELQGLQQIDCLQSLWQCLSQPGQRSPDEEQNRLQTQHLEAPRKAMLTCNKQAFRDNGQSHGKFDQHQVILAW